MKSGSASVLVLPAACVLNCHGMLHKGACSHCTSQDAAVLFARQCISWPECCAVCCAVRAMLPDLVPMPLRHAVPHTTARAGRHVSISCSCTSARDLATLWVPPVTSRTAMRAALARSSCVLGTQQRVRPSASWGGTHCWRCQTCRPSRSVG
jgi:hypothetical protein